jgi:hypothetical protein
MLQSLHIVYECSLGTYIRSPSVPPSSDGTERPRNCITRVSCNGPSTGRETSPSQCRAKDTKPGSERMNGYHLRKEIPKSTEKKDVSTTMGKLSGSVLGSLCLFRLSGHTRVLAIGGGTISFGTKKVGLCSMVRARLGVDIPGGRKWRGKSWLTFGGMSEIRRSIPWGRIRSKRKGDGRSTFRCMGWGTPHTPTLVFPRASSTTDLGLAH